MVYEERIRRGLKRAGLAGNKWIELLALNMLPDPGHRDLSGRSALWKFSRPRWLYVNIVTGRTHRMNHYLQGAVNLANPSFLEYVYREKYVKIPYARIRAIEFGYISEPDFFYKE